MECGSTVNGSTKKKAKACELDAVDTFELLPESLISCILSLVPTKDAVRTSVLSKRWIDRWKSITKIDIDDSVFCSPKRRSSEEQDFVNFVDRALYFTRNSSVESFSLAISNRYDVSCLVRWISFLSQDVKKLCVETALPLHFATDAFHSLLNCISLEELVLSSVCLINVSTIYVCFGHLKILKLCGIVFAVDASSDCLTLCLPVLKKFETRHCVWLSAEGVTIKAPLLESVFIEQDTFVSSCISISASNKLRRCSIKFSDCHLREFTYRGDGISHPLILSDPSSAHNASVDIKLDKYYKVPAPRLYSYMLLNQFSQAKSIKVGGAKLFRDTQDLGQPEAVLYVLPVFTMLIHLDIGAVAVEVLWGFLQRSPSLKTLVVREIVNIYNIGTELLNSAAKSHCLVSSLQDVKFELTNGRKAELIIAKFLIENGMVLQTVTLTKPKSMVTQRKSKVMKEFKKLFSFKKASPSLVLNFHD